MEFRSIQSTAAIPVSLHPGELGYAILNPHNPDDGDWARNWSTAQALAERILPKLQVW